MHIAATASYNISPPETFDFSNPEDWPKWLIRFEMFRKASGLNLNEEVVQVNTLLYSLADAADDVVCSFNLSEKDAKNYMIMVWKFE